MAIVAPVLGFTPKSHIHSLIPLVPPSTTYPLPHDDRAPPPEQSGRAPPRSAPFDSPHVSAPQAPRPPPRFEVPPTPHQVGFRLALLRHARVVTLQLQSWRPVTGTVLLPSVTPPPHG